MASKFTADEVFDQWQKWAKGDHGTNRFLAKKRDELLTALFDAFLENDIDVDEARFYRKDINEILVTKEGKKGKGAHKGWNENVESDFNAMLANRYGDGIGNGVGRTKTAHTVEDYGNHPYMPHNPVMTAWAQDRFGKGWNDKLNLLVHQQGHRFCQEFQLDVLDSNWAKTGEDAPDWAKRLFNL